MESVDPWADFETQRHNIKQNTVDRLKQILSAFNDECGTNFTKTGKKQDIIDKINRELDSWRRNNNTEKWAKGRAILMQIRHNGIYTSTRPKDSYTSGVMSTGSHHTGSPINYTNQATGSNGPSYETFTIRRPSGHPPPPPAASSSSSGGFAIRFKPSPFYKFDRQISSVVECPESSSQMDRKSQNLNFTITEEVVQKIASKRYQLRLFCTSSTYHSNSTGYRATQLCPIEFPPTCEVRVNQSQLQANLKGMKKRPGTAPPPDLGKAVRVINGAQNRVEIVYVNSQQPVQSKKYYIVVMLVEVTSVEQLVDRLKKGKYKSCQEILGRMQQQAQNDDDDIVAGHQKMSLKCPLSYMRIATPCRSWLCVHAQCFDAFSWYSVMEQTTTWMCPVCEKVLNVDDLIVDGYFDQILRVTPDDIEDVVVEADGEWHTADNDYGSDEWLAAHPPVKKDPPPMQQRSPTPVKPSLAELNGKAKAIPDDAEIVILDSDDEDEDEDEGRVKRELSPSNEGTQSQTAGLRTANASMATIPPQTQQTDVIDLTLDSDDETSAPPPPSLPPPLPSSLPPIAVPPTKKRKADERDVLSPTETIWKKSRPDTLTPPNGSGSAGQRAPISNGASVLYSYPVSPPAVAPRPSYPSHPPSPTSTRYMNASPTYHTGPSHVYPSFAPGGHPSLPPRPPLPTDLLNGRHHHAGSDGHGYNGGSRYSSTNGQSSSSGTWRR